MAIRNFLVRIKDQQHAVTELGEVVTTAVASSGCSQLKLEDFLSLWVKTVDTSRSKETTAKFSISWNRGERTECSLKAPTSLSLNYWMIVSQAIRSRRTNHEHCHDDSR